MAKAKRKRRKAEADDTGRGAAIRPTAERRRRGNWADPVGTMKASQPTVDMASDAVGQLYRHNLITVSQEQAARLFQDRREAYRRELPGIADFKSCLAGSVPGFDDGDGDPVVIEAYRRLEALIGRHARAVMLATCEDGRIPNAAGLQQLRGALDRIAGRK